MPSRALRPAKHSPRTALWPLGAPALAALLCAGAAAAALPRAEAHFSGSLPEYTNNAPVWRRGAEGQVSFDISKDRRRVTRFRGTYANHCGAGHAFVRAAYLNVSGAGAFSYDFSFPSHSAGGRRRGTTFVAINGHFLPGGRSAQLSYLIDAVPPGDRRVKHPYSTAHARGLGCAIWVHGVIAAA